MGCDECSPHRWIRPRAFGCCSMRPAPAGRPISRPRGPRPGDRRRVGAPRDVLPQVGHRRDRSLLGALEVAQPAAKLGGGSAQILTSGNVWTNATRPQSKHGGDGQLRDSVHHRTSRATSCRVTGGERFQGHPRGGLGKGWQACRLNRALSRFLPRIVSAEIP